MKQNGLKSRKKWGIFLLVWPVITLVLTFILFAVLNWAFNSAASDTSSGSLFGESGGTSTVANVILFVMGAASVLLGLPSMIVGIILLATTGSPREQQAPIDVSASNGRGSAIAGMVLGICSVVLFWALGFVLGILAIIFSSIALKKHTGKGMAVTGLVTGIIGTLLSLVVGFLIIVGSYASIQERATDGSVESNAYTVQKNAEIFHAENEIYPDLNEIRQKVNATGSDVVIGEQGVGSSEDVVYIPCYGKGAIIWYWSIATEEYKELGVGSTDDCSWN